MKAFFNILPYRNSNSINDDYVKLCLRTEDGKTIDSQTIRFDAWKNNEADCQSYWKYQLIINNLNKFSNYRRSGEFELDKEVYDNFYRWYFFIDGEDARCFIELCEASQHSTHFQTAYAVQVGWKYFKILKQHDFNDSVAAMMAYTRGYLEGMKVNSPWSHEDEEVLDCLGLQYK